MPSAYVVDILRTPIGKYGGALATTRPDDLAAFVIKELINEVNNLGVILFNYLQCHKQ